LERIVAFLTFEHFYFFVSYKLKLNVQLEFPLMSNIPEAEVNSLVIGQLIVEPPEVEATFVEVEATSVEFRPGIVIYEPSAGRRCSRMSAFFKARATKERVPLIKARMNGRCLHASGSYNIFCTKIKLNFFVLIH
jgi:hypothetical protein